jgi:hypothetical protein
MIKLQNMKKIWERKVLIAFSGVAYRAMYFRNLMIVIFGEQSENLTSNLIGETKR